jgi:hypothetical protein
LQTSHRDSHAPHSPLQLPQVTVSSVTATGVAGNPPKYSGMYKCPRDALKRIQFEIGDGLCGWSAQAGLTSWSRGTRRPQVTKLIPQVPTGDNESRDCKGRGRYLLPLRKRWCEVVRDQTAHLRWHHSEQRRAAAGAVMPQSSSFRPLLSPTALSTQLPRAWGVGWRRAEERNTQGHREQEPVGSPTRETGHQRPRHFCFQVGATPKAPPTPPLGEPRAYRQSK